MMTFWRPALGVLHRAKPGAAAKGVEGAWLQSLVPGGVPEWPKGTTSPPESPAALRATMMTFRRESSP